MNVTWPVVVDAIERNAGIMPPIGLCKQHGLPMLFVDDMPLATEFGV